MTTRCTNMWNNGSLIYNLNRILSKLAIGDTKHDFGYKVDELKNINFKDAYNSGIPQPYNNEDVVDEEYCLQSVVKEISNEEKNDYIPMKIANPNLEKKKDPNEHTIKTINDFNFVVNYCIVKDEKGKDINAEQFYTNLNLNKSRNIAIIVDAASIGLYEILNNGKFDDVKPKVYYIYGPEVVNDPATKKGVDAKEFSQKDGVEIISCLPVETPNYFESYNYSFNTSLTEDTPYLQQFFTNYTFKLTDLKTFVKGKSTEYITNLTIYGPGSKPIPLPNSKSKNDISFLSSILNRFKNLFTGGIFKTAKKITDDEQFLFSASLQQKRSGDWLQVLLCCAIKDKLRKFKEFKTNREVDDIQDVYFVTHDRIALAFALLNGMNCIFTHHNSANHLHSCFVYKLQDVEAEEKANSKLAITYKSNKNKAELKTLITNLINNINKYMIDKYNGISSDNFPIGPGSIETTLEANIDSRLKTFSNKTSTSNPATTEQYNLNMFSLDVRDFFEKALKVVFAKSIFPDLRNQIELLKSLNNIIDDELADKIVDNIIIVNYRKIKTTIDNINSIYTKANETTTDQCKTKIQLFTKSEIYKRSLNWTWDINLSSRDVANLADTTNPLNYSTDRNIFLYNINELNILLKQKLTYLYYYNYTKLLERCIVTTEQNLNTKFKLNELNKSVLNHRYYVKFRAVSLAFCIEVLLALGENGVKPNPNSKRILTPKEISDTMDNFLSKDPKTISTLLKDDLIVGEDNAYNRATIKYDIESYPDAIPDPETNITTIIGDDIDIPTTNLPPIKIVGGANITEAAFPISVKQVTYPIMTLILNNSTSYNKMFTVFGFITSIFSHYVTLENPEKERKDFINYKETPQYFGFLNKKEEDYIAPSEEYVPTSIINTPQNSYPNNLKNYEKPFKNIMGGSKKNLESLFKSLPPLEDDTPIERYDEDIFKDNSICFHPLLPIYMLTQSYMTTVENEDIEESMDFDLFVNYLKFLKKIKENVVNIYSSDNTNETKLEAYAVGLGLKQLLFVSNNDIDGYEDCLDVLDADPKIYSKASSFTDCLCNSISGKIEHDDITLVNGPIYLKSDLFRQFARQLHVNRIFGITVDATTFDLNKFKREIFEFSKEVAEQIINDRKSSGSLDESVGISITESLPDQQNKFGLTKEELERQKEKRETATKQYEDGIKVPKYKPQNITDASSFFEKENKKNPNRATEFQTVESNSTSPTIRRGGKSRKIKKQKRTKRKNKKINRKTRRFRKTRKY